MNVGGYRQLHGGSAIIKLAHLSLLLFCGRLPVYYRLKWEEDGWVGLELPNMIYVVLLLYVLPPLPAFLPLHVFVSLFILCLLMPLHSLPYAISL